MRSEAEPVEAGPSYILPVTEVTIESSSGAALDAHRYNTMMHSDAVRSCYNCTLPLTLINGNICFKIKASKQK